MAGRDDRESPGALSHHGNLTIVEHHGGSGTAGLQLRLELDGSHRPILAHRELPLPISVLETGTIDQCASASAAPWRAASYRVRTR